MITDFAYYFLLSTIGIVWFYFTGTLLMKLLKISIALTQLNTLLSLLIGIVSHVIIFSIFKTHFATLNVILLLILFAIWIEFRKLNKFNPIQRGFKFHLLQLTELSLVLLLLYGIKVFSTVDPKIYPFFNSGRDDIFYSQISGFISRYGKENFFIDWVSDVNSLGIVPYHYFELWLNGLYTDITGLLSINVYFFVTSVIITLLLYQTILMIIGEVTGQNIELKHKIIAISLFFLGDFFYGMIPHDTWPSLTRGLNLYKNIKIVTVFIVLALSWQAWKSYLYTISLLTLLMIPLLNYGLMPVILFSVPLFFIIHHWFLKTPESIPYRKVLIYYISYLVLLIAIQKIFKNSFDGMTTLGLRDLITYYDNFPKIKTLVHFIMKYFIMTALLALPFIFIFIPLKKHKLLSFKSGFTILTLIILLTSLGLSSVLYFIVDTSQIFTITMNILSHLLLYCTIPLLFFKVPKSYFYKVWMCIYLLSGIYLVINDFIYKASNMSRYSTVFLNSVQSISNKIHGQGIRYLAPSYYTSAYLLNSNCNFEGYYLSFLKNDIIIHTVTVNEIPNRKELHDFFNYNKKLILKSSYYLNFVHQMKLENVSNDSAQFIFVKENNIDFIVAIKGARIPDGILRLITKKIEDPVSRETLMLIDRKRLPEN